MKLKDHNNLWATTKSIANNQFVDLINSRWDRKIDSEKTVVSLFAGGGGSSTGYRMAGLREVLAVDSLKSAIKTLNLNHDFPTYHGSVWDTQTILDMIDEPVFWLDASPPCQAFSTLNKFTDKKDLRLQAYKSIFPIAEALQPTIISIENVSGFLTKKYKYVIDDIKLWAKNNDYYFYSQLLFSCGYLVPQVRQRSFVILSKVKLNRPFPEPFPVYISVKEALVNADLSNNRPLQDKIAKDYHKVIPGRGYDDIWDYGFSIQKSYKDRPATAITATSASGVSRLHYDECRNISIGEMKRMFTLPDSYILPDSYSMAHKLLGNSVPPFLIYSIVTNTLWNLAN